MSFLRYLLACLGSAWRSFNGWCDRNPRLSVTVLVIPAIVLAVALLSGCSTTTEARAEIQRQTRAVTKTTTQQITSTGEIVELTTISTTITDEQSGQVQSSHTEVQPPKVVGSIGKILGTAAGFAGGPVMKEAVEQGFDWLGTLITGGTGVALTAGAGHVAIGRRLQRQRDELIDGIEAASEELTDEQWKILTKHLGIAQSADTKAAVKARVG